MLQRVPGLSLGVKRLVRGVDHPPPHLGPRLKKEYSYTSTPLVGLRGLFWGELYMFFNSFYYQSFYNLQAMNTIKFLSWFDTVISIAS